MSCIEIFGFVLNDTLCRTSRKRKHNPEMFSRISDALQAAADVVAPPCPRVEDLRYHWTQLSMISQRCQHDEAQGPAVEETHVPRHLKQMLRMLVAEEQEQMIGGALSPCMEYLVQEKVLAMLASHARADRPLGIRQHVYIFLVGVLNHLHHTHLHHGPIHKPLQVMVKASCEMRASPYELEEMEFLSNLCEKVQQDSSIILLYIQPIALVGGVPGGFTPDDSFPPTPTHELANGATPTHELANGATQEGQSSASSEKSLPKFPLIDALLNMCHSADSKISCMAHDCLIAVASIRQGHCSSTIARHTLLPHYLATRLVTSADAIPDDTEPALIEDIPLSDKARTASADSSDSDEEDEVGEFPGRKEVVTFLQWLTFCDKVVGACDGVLGSSICGTIREVFLEGVLRGSLMSQNEDTVSLFLAITTKIVTSISSPLLVNSTISWLSEDNDELEGEDCAIRSHIMKLCQHPPHHLQIQSLRLLQVMIEKPGSMAVQTLVLNYIMTRGYHDSSAAEHLQSSWSDEEDERYKQREDETSPGTIPISRTMAPANISKIVKRFLMIVPEELRSTNKDDFESYMADAERQYKDVCRTCVSFGWPREAVTPECLSDSSSTASRESKPEAEGTSFYEGPLLRMLMDFIEHLADQDYDINLQVTSLVATLSLLPHPYLHEYLLNPTVTLAEGARTPYTVLSTVVSKIQQPVMEREDYHDHLKVTRYQLLGTMEEFDFDRDDDDRKFEALIVIEEFTKELASIAYAKYSTECSGY